MFLSCPSSVFMNSWRSSSHLLLGLPTYLLVLMLVSNPGCQLNTLRFHLFAGRVMILLAMRHFCLLCTSIQHFKLCFFMFSSASLVLLLMYSNHSSSFSVASISSSASSWKDTSLSWSFFESILLSSFICLFVGRTFIVFFVRLFSALVFFYCCFFQFVFSFRVYNQAKHLSLRCLDHLLVFQRQCPRAAGVGHRWCYHHTEKAKSVAETIVFRCQFLAIFVERRPRCFQSVFDFLCFLILERDLLPKVSRTCCLLQDFNLDFFDFDLFCFHFVLVAEYLRLVWVDSQTHGFRTDLEFTEHVT